MHHSLLLFKSYPYTQLSTATISIQESLFTANEYHPRKPLLKPVHKSVDHENLIPTGYIYITASASWLRELWKGGAEILLES